MINLTHSEKNIVEILTDGKSISRPLDELEAAIYTVLLMRGYTGPRKRIMKIVRYFIPGKTESEINAALEKMLYHRLIEQQREEEIGLSENWSDSLSQVIGPQGGFSPDFHNRVVQGRRSYERDLIDRVGRSSSDRVAQRMRKHILGATRRIRLGCFSSAVLFDDIADALKRACVTQYRINLQVIMFSPELGLLIEGDPAVEVDIKCGLEDWRKLFEAIAQETANSKHEPRCELKWLGADHPEFAGVHRMLIIDDSLWMMNIHRIGIDRGVDGLAYQGSSERGAPATIYRVIDYYWESAWRYAEPQPGVPAQPAI